MFAGIKSRKLHKTFAFLFLQIEMSISQIQYACKVYSEADIINTYVGIHGILYNNFCIIL